MQCRSSHSPVSTICIPVQQSMTEQVRVIMDRQTDWDILCSRFFLYLMSWRIRESAGVWKVFHKWGSLGHKTETWLTKNLQDREPDLLNMSHSWTQHWLMTQWQLMVIFTCQLPYLQGRRPQTMWHHIPAGSNCQLTTVRTSLSLCQVYTIRHSENHASWNILIIKANEMHNFSN